MASSAVGGCAGGATGSRLEAMAFTDQVPLILRGDMPVANQALRELGKPGVTEAQANAITQMYADTRMADTVRGGFEVRADSRIRSDPTAFHPIYAMTTKVVANSLLDLQTLPLDAIVMLGTGMPSLELVLAANHTGKSTPVLSCMLCLAWCVFSRINQDTADLASWLLGQHWRSAFEARRSVVV